MLSVNSFKQKKPTKKPMEKTQTFGSWLPARIHSSRLPSSWLCNFGVGQPWEAWPTPTLQLTFRPLEKEIPNLGKHEGRSNEFNLLEYSSFTSFHIDSPWTTNESPVATFLACTKPAGIHSPTAIFFMAVMWPLSSLPTTWHQQQFGFGFQFQAFELMKCDMSQMSD